MVAPRSKVRIGILGCGAIGSRLALSVRSECPADAAVTAIYDINPLKAQALAKRFSKPSLIKTSFSDLLKSCDFIVEAVNAADTKNLVWLALTARKDVLAMSVGKLLNAPELFALARKTGRKLILPSGAVAGIDALKAASLGKLSRVTLISRKPVRGFAQSPYLTGKKIFLDRLRKETVLFEGRVADAVKWFPQNINVAATVALASRVGNKLTVRIVASPAITRNSHEIEAVGAFGRLTTKTENEVCPDNPKTSYLAVLSAVQTLKQYFEEVKIGT